VYDDCGDYVDNIDNDVDHDIDDDDIDDAMLTRLSSSTGCLALEQSIQPSLYT
jgi:hypothetical protein